MAQLHILHLLGTSKVEGTGIAKIVVALAERLDPQKFKLHAWFLLDHGPLVAMLEKKGVPVRVINWTGGARNPVGLWRFFRAIQSHKFALVHQHFGGRSIRWISHYAGGARIIAHLHGCVFEQNWEVPARCNVDGADLVVATSATVAKWAGVNAEVVYPGVDVKAPTHDAAAGREGTGHNLGAAGRLVPMKGLQYLIRALPIVRGSVPGAELEIAGAGPEEEALRNEAHGLGVGGCIRFLGWQEDIPFHRWNVFVMPSLEESFGIAALEAMAAGLPVVASAVGGLTELLEDGKTGWLVSPADPKALANRLIPLLLNAREREQMGAAAWTRATEFSAKRMNDHIERLYNRLLP
jgi:glycosyltransferase involved in cell wall biosynthesis